MASQRGVGRSARVGGSPAPLPRLWSSVTRAQPRPVAPNAPRRSHLSPRESKAVAFLARTPRRYRVGLVSRGLIVEFLPTVLGQFIPSNSSQGLPPYQQSELRALGSGSATNRTEVPRIMAQRRSCCGIHRLYCSWSKFFISFTEKKIDTTPRFLPVSFTPFPLLQPLFSS